MKEAPLFLIIFVFAIAMFVEAAAISSYYKGKAKLLADETLIPTDMVATMAIEEFTPGVCVISSHRLGRAADELVYLRSQLTLANKELEQLHAQNFELENNDKKEKFDHERPALQVVTEDMVWLLGYIKRLQNGDKRQNDDAALKTVKQNFASIRRELGI
jgi:hypothetical protein